MISHRIALRPRPVSISRRAVLAGLAALPASSLRAEAESVLIEVVAPITGLYPDYGDKIRTSAQIWRELANAKGGILGRPIDLDFDDDAGDPRQAASAANRAIGKRPIAVLGHGLSNTTAVAAPFYEQSGVLFLAMSNADTLTQNPSPGLLRVLPRNSDYAIHIARDIAETAACVAGPIAFLHDGGAYGKGLADDALRLLPPMIASRVTLERISRGDKDFSAPVTRLQAAQTPIVLLALDVAEAGAIVRQSGERGYTPQFFGHSALSFGQFAAAAGVNVTHVRVVALAGADRDKLANDAATAELYDSFKKAGRELTDVGLIVTSSLGMLKQAVESCRSLQMEDISAALHAGSFEEPIGRLRFDAAGNVMGPLLVPYRWQVGGTALAPTYTLQQIEP